MNTNRPTSVLAKAYRLIYTQKLLIKKNLPHLKYFFLSVLLNLQSMSVTSVNN